ncbi:MAG: hypothetical protein Q8R18_06450 [bacterium]|nr:hypothetical protein [bacterium]
MVKKKRGGEVNISSIVLEAPIHLPKRKGFQIGKLLVRPKKLTLQIPKLEYKHSIFANIFEKGSLLPLKNNLISTRKKLFPQKEITFPELEKKTHSKKIRFPELASFKKQDSPHLNPKNITFPELAQQKEDFSEIKESSNSISFSELTEEEEKFPNPLEKTNELLQKCRKALQNGNLNYAQIFYEELKPFYLRISSQQRSEIHPIFVELQQDLEMLHLRFVRQKLKKHLHISFSHQLLSNSSKIQHIQETVPQVLPIVFLKKKVYGSSLEILSDLDSFEQCVELIQKSQKALEKGNVNFAMIYSEELKVIYPRLSLEQQNQLQNSFLEIQQSIEMLQLTKVREILKRS